MFISWMVITPSLKKSLIVEQFQENYLNLLHIWQASWINTIEVIMSSDKMVKMVNFKLGNEMWRWINQHEMRVGQKTGIKPVNSQTLGGHTIHWATRTRGPQEEADKIWRKRPNFESWTKKGATCTHSAPFVVPSELMKTDETKLVKIRLSKGLCSIE